MPRSATVVPRVRDVLLWLTLSVFLVILRTSHGASGPELASWWQVGVGSVGWGVAVAVSRRWPLPALVITALLGVMDQWFTVPLFVMSYLVGRRMPNARPVMGTLAALFLFFSALLVVADANYEQWLNLCWSATVTAVLPWLAGRYRRLYQELVSAGWERAEQLEREQRMIADQARLRERARIAQDMHDSLGHELSLVALRAGAFELARDLPERLRADATQLRLAAGAATERLREVVGVLRDESDPVRLVPAGEQVDALVDRARASGVSVELRRDGEPVPLAPMVDRAVYRIVQEGLTNAVKHAAGAEVTVRLVHHPGEVEVSVTNGPPPAGSQTAVVSGERGLIGLRERARTVGGTLRAGPRDGGFEVTARLPLAGTALPRDESAASARSESQDQRARVQRRLRQGLVRAIAAPVAVGVALLALDAGFFAYKKINSVLAPGDYARIAVGQPIGEVVPLLPPWEAPDRRADPGAPPGADCRYYRSGGSLFTAGPGVYRLCFAAGMLVAKDFLPVIENDDTSKDGGP